mmetsp:Transcript_21355/g.39895  ORF Transcript_21355/g.39895 Transcript_21355/m.39895 type:complete len:107 (-) Transcript_21355:18-338(-)
MGYFLSLLVPSTNLEPCKFKVICLAMLPMTLTVSSLHFHYYFQVLSHRDCCMWWTEENISAALGLAGKVQFVFICSDTHSFFSRSQVALVLFAVIYFMVCTRRMSN